jgi:hypothetical protein
MCEVFNCGAEFEMVEGPEAFDEGPEALFEVDIVCEAGCELGGAVVLR